MACYRSNLLPPLFAAWLLTGCATIFAGTKSDVLFTSVPSGATVIAGDLRGTTPVTLKLAKSTKSVRFIPPTAATTVKVSMDGASPSTTNEREVQLDREFDVNWLLFDLSCTPGFGIVGEIVDGTTSAWYELPRLVHCDLTKTQAMEDTENEAWFNEGSKDTWH